MFFLLCGMVIEDYVVKSCFLLLKEFYYDEKNNFFWIDFIVGGVILGNFMFVIEKGFKECMV